MKLISIGECMLELAPDGPNLFKSGFAGDTFNTAWYVAQLSAGTVQPMFLTAVGDDAASSDMIAFMESSGVRPLAKQRLGKSVGLYMISLQDGERSFSYWRDTSAARTLAADLDTIPAENGDIVYFSGITLGILPPQDRANFLHVLRASKAKGATIMFDPNLRPRLWQDQTEMCDWIMRGAAIADICLPSFDDESQHFGDPSPKATAERYAAQGTPIVVVKNGSDPITIYENGNWREVAVQGATDIVDTTAAGDSFNAGLILSYSKNDNLEEAALFGAQLAAKVIAERGALVDLTGP